MHNDFDWNKPNETEWIGWFESNERMESPKLECNDMKTHLLSESDRGAYTHADAEEYP